MGHLTSFLTTLWLTTAAAQLGFIKDFTKDVTKGAQNEVQAIADPLGKTIAFVGAKTVTYNLTLAPEEIPLERWFNPELPFRIFLHGFTDDPSKSSYKTISEAFLEQTGLDSSKIHLIGHSLGSHIAGFTAKTFYNQTGYRVARISSLDPAGPCFSNLEIALRLSKEDADFVDVIHTDAGVYGLNEQIGHVDFYPNSGSEQPNCLFQTCSHSRAWLLYAESVLIPESFIGAECSSWKNFMKGSCDFNNTSVMGYYCPTDSRGKYYLQTKDEPPYGLRVAGLTYVNNAGIVRNIKYLVTGK
ncbi:hypothetical protein HF086_017495 [Spodoptera exigua]|uniref:Lipase domain-containing protein n=1 Tax=Spodoptera exigua TaxID=7107 RepID=A0A922M4H2_SPOEX|nr:hypothetical protein HF086_017495 [Spodoptera exigua]